MGTSSFVILGVVAIVCFASGALFWHVLRRGGAAASPELGRLKARNEELEPMLDEVSRLGTRNQQLELLLDRVPELEAELERLKTRNQELEQKVTELERSASSSKPAPVVSASAITQPTLPRVEIVEAPEVKVPAPSAPTTPSTPITPAPAPEPPAPRSAFDAVKPALSFRGAGADIFGGSSGSDVFSTPSRTAASVWGAEPVKEAEPAPAKKVEPVKAPELPPVKKVSAPPPKPAFEPARVSAPPLPPKPTVEPARVSAPPPAPKPAVVSAPAPVPKPSIEPVRVSAPPPAIKPAAVPPSPAKPAAESAESARRPPDLEGARRFMQALYSDAAVAPENREALLIVLARFFRVAEPRARELGAGAPVGPPFALNPLIESDPALNKGQRETVLLLYRRLARRPA